MSSQSNQPDLRRVDLARTGDRHYRATNRRGGELSIGSGADADFTPVELLLAGLAGCSAIDVDLITGKRADPDVFLVRAEAEKVRDERGNHLQDIRITFDVRFPESEAGDAARSVVPRSLEQTRDRLCTVGRTVAIGVPTEYLTGELTGDAWGQPDAETDADADAGDEAGAAVGDDGPGRG